MGTKVKQEIVLWINLSWFQNLCSITIFLVGLCILCFIKSKLGSHLSKCSLKSWRLWGKLVQRAKFSIKFWRCRAGQGRGNNLTTILSCTFSNSMKKNWCFFQDGGAYLCLQDAIFLHIEAILKPIKHYKIILFKWMSKNVAVLTEGSLETWKYICSSFNFLLLEACSQWNGIQRAAGYILTF